MKAGDSTMNNSDLIIDKCDVQQLMEASNMALTYPEHPQTKFGMKCEIIHVSVWLFFLPLGIESTRG